MGGGFNVVFFDQDKLEIEAKTKLVKVTQTFGTGDTCLVDAATAHQNVEAMRRLYQSTDIGLAPYECRDVADRFRDVMTFADNAFMAADPARKGREPNTVSNSLLESALKDCRKNIERLRYEMEKVT